MPPEPLPWDRRDFRKHERSGSDSRLGGGGFGGGGPHRWREQHHHPHGPPPHPAPYHHHHQQRWYSDFRSSRALPPGHGKQGGWPMYSDEAGHGFLPFGSRYGERNLEDENCRPFGSRGDGRYFRNNRENSRGSFSQKDWKAPSCEPGASQSGPGRPTAEANQRSTEKPQTCHISNTSKNDEPSQPPLDSVNQVDQSQSPPKEQIDKTDDTADGLPSVGQKPEKENGLGSIDWKPLKWPRSGSLSSRGSGFSHSSSSNSKNVGVDSVETVTEVQVKNLTPVQSPSAEAVPSIISAALAPSDENNSRKKPRLGWGEGLAKYEKKKVEGPEDGVMKNEMATCAGNPETSHSQAVNLLDKSPRVASFSDCASPATPSSVACSSSPGIEEKESVKAVNADRDTTNLYCSPRIMSQNPYDGPILNLENLELSSIAELSTLINELLQSDDPISVDTGYVRTSPLNKLLVWKVDVLKALEVTETEIDSLETELKSLVAETTSCCPFPASSSLLPRESGQKPCEELVTSSNFIARPAPLQVVSSGDLIAENKPVTLEDEHLQLKNEDFDSPGSATSKFTEVLPSGEDIFPSETIEGSAGFVNLNVKSNLDEKCLENGSAVEEPVGCVGTHDHTSTKYYQDLASGRNVYYNVDCDHDSIMATNQDSANSVLEELNKLLPANHCLFDGSTASTVSYLRKNSPMVMKKFLKRKRFLKFKEKVITLKYKVFQHFWKEGRIVSVRKLRMKSHKKFDLSRTIHKKNRSSSRSRISTAGNPRTVPADEVIEFINVMLSESGIKPCRSVLKMPALILDKKAMRMSRFISTNGLVEDPCAAEKDRSLINPWTAEEREIFIDKLAAFGKDFKKIASFLDHKTIADCIEFYYKNHKSECFERARKKPDFMKQSKSTMYLVASGKRWNREANAASLDILGAASAIAANVDDGIEIQQKCTSRLFFGVSSSYRAPREDDSQLQRSNSLDVYSSERETIAADVLAGICGSLSSEAMSSCITSSVDPGDGHQDWRCQRVGSSTKQPLTPEVTQSIDDECSDESCGEMDPTDWTDEEKSIFVRAVSSYGKNFALISQCVRTRSRDQCKVFYSKARKCLGLDQIQPGADNAGSEDFNGGDSDSEDACILEPGSVVCNEISGSKMDEDFPPSDVKLSHESDISGTESLKPDFKICDGSSGLGLLDHMAAEPVSKNSLIGDSRVDEKPAIDCNMDCKDQNGAVGVRASGQGFEARTVASNTEAVLIKEENHCSLPSASSENNSLTVVSNGNLVEDNDRQGPLTDNLDRKVEDRDAASSEASGISCGVNDRKSDSLLAGNNSHPSVDVPSSVQIHNSSACQKKPDLGDCPAETSNITPLQQKGTLASIESSTLFSVPIKYQKNPTHDVLSAAVGGPRNGDKHTPRIVRNGDCQLRRSGYSSDTVESSQILRGYPVSVQTMKEINGDVSCKKPVSFQNVSRRDGIIHSDRHTGFPLQRCNGSRQQSKSVESPFPFQEQSREHSTAQSGRSCDGEKPSKNGDVKLFGKILKSTEQKPDSCVQGTDSNDSQNHKGGGQSLNLKLNGDEKVNLDSAQSKFDCNNYLGSENIPVRSFGFWDGNRMQTGFAPLPDSTLLLTKYPAAFSGNYAIPALKLEQPSINGVAKSNDHRPLNGVSVFPSSRELSSTNGVAEFQMLRNREVQQPFTIDVKQSQDVLFSEMQRRNGFDLVSGMQQQTRGMIGINVVGRGGVLVGGQCSGVSDPVAAIKMHYAKAEQFGVQAGNVIKEDDAWRSNGDVGR